MTTQALMDIWQASETRHSKSILENFQHQYLPELLINDNVYSYGDEKCVLLLCAWKAAFLKSSHMYTYYFYTFVW